MNEIALALAQTVLSIVAPEATIVFAGDAMQHIAQIEAARTTDGTYDYSGYFDAIKQYVGDADYAVVNLETPLGGKPYSGYPCFCSPDEYADELKNAGFDMFLTANNHTLDRHHKGLIRTIETLDRKNIDHIGTYTNKLERDSVIPFIKNIKGFKIGFLNYTYGTNGIPVTGNVIVDFIDKDKIKSDIEKTRKAGAEIITAAIHWGVEYQLLPEKSQKELADFLTELGVDLIIGGHPHVIQPMEMRRSEKYDKNIFLVYSLGNFISNMKTRDTRGGAMARVTLTRDSAGRAIVKNAGYSLVFTEAPSMTNKNFRLVPAEKCDGVWKNACDAFEKSATRIFDRYNKNIKREYIDSCSDSSQIHSQSLIIK